MISPHILNLETKKLVFAYFVDVLYRWNKELDSTCQPKYSKLQLQKLLFLASAIDVGSKCPGMLDVFNRFYALPYGPVEMDIYSAMNSDSLMQIKVIDRICEYNPPQDKNLFDTIPVRTRELVNHAVSCLKQQNVNYFSISPFDLVKITHRWSAWRDAFAMATLCGSKQEPMSAESICESEVKSFSL